MTAAGCSFRIWPDNRTSTSPLLMFDLRGAFICHGDSWCRRNLVRHVGDKIVLMLRDSRQPEDNGVWLVFSDTANLADSGIRRDFPSIRLIGLLGGKIGIGDSSLLTVQPSSPKPCTPASSSSNPTCGSGASRRRAKGGPVRHGAANNRTVQVSGVNNPTLAPR